MSLVNEIVIGYILWGVVAMAAAVWVFIQARKRCQNPQEALLACLVMVAVAICAPTLVFAVLWVAKALADPMQAALFHFIP